jgi:hypothetical protein
MVTGIERSQSMKLWLKSLTRLEQLAPGTLVLPSARARGSRPASAGREHHEHQLCCCVPPDGTRQLQRA